MMKKIVLLCNMGMSTSLMVTKMKQAAEKTGYDCEIAAYALDEAKEAASDADCILVGPQVKFKIKKIEEACPGVPVKDIDMRNYGSMNGEAVLEMAKKMIG